MTQSEELANDLNCAWIAPPSWASRGIRDPPHVDIGLLRWRWDRAQSPRAGRDYSLGRWSLSGQGDDHPNPGATAVPGRERQFVHETTDQRHGQRALEGEILGVELLGPSTHQALGDGAAVQDVDLEGSVTNERLDPNRLLGCGGAVRRHRARTGFRHGQLDVFDQIVVRVSKPREGRDGQPGHSDVLRFRG